MASNAAQMPVALQIVDAFRPRSEFVAGFNLSAGPRPIIAVDVRSCNNAVGPAAGAEPFANRDHR